jgi:hypothetical protein
MGLSTEIILGAGTIAALHAAIPNHWVPLVAIARSEGWSRRGALITSAIVALFHVMGTIIAGFVIAFGGVSLMGSLESAHDLPRYILILFGLSFLWSGLRHSRTCRHHKLRFVAGDLEEHPVMRKLGIAFALSASMFLSPCIDILGFFLSVSFSGWVAVWSVAVIFALVTVPVLVGLVAIGLMGADAFNWKLIDHHGETVTGLLLIILGVLGFYFE